MTQSVKYRSKNRKVGFLFW